jgi:hypothetical protein
MVCEDDIQSMVMVAEDKARKKGALEELESILKESEILFEKDRDFRELFTDLQVIIELRIKELIEGD